MTQSYLPFPIILESRDVHTMARFGHIVCRKCEIELREGDTIIRIGKRPPKYYHKNCFKQY